MPAALRKSFIEFFYCSFSLMAVKGYIKFLVSCRSSFKYIPILPLFMINATFVSYMRRSFTYTLECPLPPYLPQEAYEFVSFSISHSIKN